MLCRKCGCKIRKQYCAIVSFIRIKHIIYVHVYIMKTLTTLSITKCIICININGILYLSVATLYRYIYINLSYREVHVLNCLYLLYLFHMTITANAI